jgi:hypothetical protein
MSISSDLDHPYPDYPMEFSPPRSFDGDNQNIGSDVPHTYQGSTRIFHPLINGMSVFFVYVLLMLHD